MMKDQGLTIKQLAQRRAAASKGGTALVAKRGRDYMAEIGRRGGKRTFFDQVRNATSRASGGRRP